MIGTAPAARVTCLQAARSSWLSFPVGDGNEVHRRQDDGCLIRYGERWRTTARQALARMGVLQPSEDPGDLSMFGEIDR